MRQGLQPERASSRRAMGCYGVHVEFSELIHCWSSAAPVVSTMRVAMGGIWLESRRLILKYSTDLVASPGATTLAFVTPRSPDAGVALHVLVLSMAVVYRKSRLTGVPPPGR